MRRVVSSGSLRLVVDVDRGSRITSLTSPTREWLLPSTPDPDSSVGADYGHPGAGGWDEIMPTVQADLSTGPKTLHDHGDVWNVPWAELEHTTTSLTTQVEAQTVPVKLTRQITATEDGGFLLSYRAETTSVESFPLLWSAHPLFEATQGTCVILPGGEQPEMLKEHPNAGGTIQWPAGGRVTALDPKTALKAFITQPGRYAAAHVSHDDGALLTLSWDPTLLPYLGLFWDRGEFSSAPVVAIEPTTAQGETPGQAASRAAILTLCSDAPLDWWVKLNVDE